MTGQRLYRIEIRTLTPLFGGFPWFQQKSVGLFVKYDNEFNEVEFKVEKGNIEEVKKEYYRQGYVKIDWGFYRLKTEETVPTAEETWYVYWNNKLKYSIKHRLGLRTETKEETVQLLNIRPVDINIKIISHSWQGKPVWCEVLYGRFEGTIMANVDLLSVVKSRREVITLTPEILQSTEKLIQELSARVGIAGNMIYYVDRFGGKKNQGYGICLVTISPL